jgi:hypothetical protein
MLKNSYSQQMDNPAFQEDPGDPEDDDLLEVGIQLS